MSVAVHPQMAAILERMKAAPGLDIRSVPPAEARPVVDAANAAWNDGAPVLPTRDLVIPLWSHDCPARLYAPSGGEDGPVIVYVHGGGWTFGSLDTHDGTMRFLADAAGCRVLGIAQRLAPEHPFPEPLDDVLGALAWVEAGGLGAPVPAGRIGLAGDSSGANQALGALLARRNRGLPRLGAAALFYGCYAPDFETESHRLFGDGSYLLSTVNMAWYWRNYLGERLADAPPTAAPLRADLSDLPPVYLAAAGLDPLRDDTLLMASALARAGVSLRCDHVPGVVHGCLRLARELEPALGMIRGGGAWLAGHLDTTTSAQSAISGGTTPWNVATS